MGNTRVFYFDALRTIAILCVVLLHVTGHLGELMNYNISTIFSYSGFFETFTNNFFRIGVDLFLMLSGALLLGKDYNFKDFLSRRLPRIVKPFIFWSVVFSSLLILGSYFSSSINFVENFGVFDILGVFFNTLICKAPGSATYWFFWMMLGVYLIMPILNKWIKNSDLVELEYFLIIWIITVILDYSILIDYPVKLTDFTTPIGLVVLGYYLRFTERTIFNNVKIALGLIVASSVLMFIYSYLVVDSAILFTFHRYSILPIIEVIGVFCLFKSSKYLNNPNDVVRKLVTSCAVCSYGIYLIHSQIIMIFRKILHLSFNFTLEYIILFFAGFVLSWFIIYILFRIPILNEYIGVK